MHPLMLNILAKKFLLLHENFIRVKKQAARRALAHKTVLALIYSKHDMSY